MYKVSPHYHHHPCIEWNFHEDEVVSIFFPIETFEVSPLDGREGIFLIHVWLSAATYCVSREDWEGGLAMRKTLVGANEIIDVVLY